MLADMLSTVVWYVGVFFVFMLLLRFHLQWLRAPFRNQLGQFALATTNWAVMPARRVIPALFGFDLASLVCSWLLQAAILAVLAVLSGRDLSSAPGIAASILFTQAFVDLIQFSLEILLFALILQVILSWVNPDSPLQSMLDALCRPLLRPIRRVVPPIANVDLSPAILILVILLLMKPLGALRGLAAGLF